MRKYMEVMRCEILTFLSYRLNMVLNGSYYPVALTVQYFLWVFVYRGRVQIATYTLGGMLTYVLISNFLAMNLPIYAYYNMSMDIKEGRLHHFLSKPLGFINYYYFANAARTLYWSLITVFLAIPFIIWWRPLLIHITPEGFLNGVFFSIIGYNLAISMGFILNLLTFFIGDPFGVSGFYDFLLTLLGGGLLPLEFFPRFVMYLPFKFLYYLPTRAFMGMEIDLVKEGIFGIGWLAFFAFFVLMLWRIGVRKYEAFGG